MNEELMAILEQLERDKGIMKEILIEAVESALASAARKVWTGDKEVDIKVELDRTTGKIRAFAGDEEIKSNDFGRIAAQTAKQVVIQKIREAEKEVIYGEFQGRVGEIVSGTVYRFEKGNIIVDLGKTEGIIPKSEQSNKEEFRQGERVRAYVAEVRKETRGPQVVLSRTHPFLVRKLFELEVPEIYESIVEIKSISREAGDRTKIAVWSKDEKVDCVGACVGMRGSRVKNIVSELHGERIDIVRWSDDTKQYITAALSPAKIHSIRLDSEEHRAAVIVEEDQLSLAIGKSGQNVRLASKVTGWELDIRTQAQENEADKKKEEEKAVEKKADVKKAVAKEPKAKEADFTSFSGVGDKMAESLKEAGFVSVEDIAAAKLEDLLKVKRLGEKKAQGLIKEAKKLAKKAKK